MAFAPQIRKDMLKALDERVIPAIQNQSLIQLLAEAPFDFGAVESRALQKELLPDVELAPMQFLRRWRKEKLLSCRDPIFRIVYEGTHYEKIGVTAAAAKAMQEQGHALPDGITLLHLASPTVIYLPGNTPHSDGGPRPEVAPGITRVMDIMTGDSDIKAYMSERSPNHQFGHHHLEINDPVLVQMSKIYLDELRQRDNRLAAQAQLLALMLRLKRYLLHHRPGISNSAWPTPAVPRVSPTFQSGGGELCSEVVAYIQTHLHNPISLESLAERFNVSRVHLNRTFQRSLGTTVMRHVTAQRIEAARVIIAENPERMGDVASLVGFSTPASFCTVFRRHTGFSPTEYRARLRLDGAEQKYNE